MIEAHNVNKKKTLSTAQAVDLIRSILNNAQMKRPGAKQIAGKSNPASKSGSSANSMEETEKVLEDIHLGDLFGGNISDAGAEIEDKEPETLVASKDSEEMSAIMALEDDRIKVSVATDKAPMEGKGDKEEGIEAMHDDRKPQSSSAAEYEPSKSTPTGMVCALKEHRLCINSRPPVILFQYEV